MHCGSSNTDDSSSIHLQKRQRTDDKIRSATLDLEVLDCPICTEPLIAPIFQCDNGHTVCSICCPKLRNKCPFCALPIGDKRCRAMEKVFESISLSHALC
uniref:RING-type domain-containing protein n=1 Tax=Brassica oleracea var. oleracea TaxID=109376 RepID=A0A0D3E845_BRAOL